MMTVISMCGLTLAAVVVACVRGTVRAERYYLIRSMRRRRDRMNRLRAWRQRTRALFPISPSRN